MPEKDLTPQDNDNSKWMIVYITHNLPEAHIIVGRLKSEGIMAIVDHMAGMSAIGVTIGAWGEIRVLVHPKDYDLAESILFPEEPDELEDGEDNPDIVYYSPDEDEEDDNHDRE